MPPGPAAGRGRLGSGGRLRRPGRSGPLANLAGCRGRRGPRSPTRGGCGRHRQLRPLRGDRDLHASRGPGGAPVHRAVQRAVMPAAWGGIAPLLSTLPPAFGIAQGDRRVMVDMATTSVARGTTAAYAGRDQPLQAGWALDAQGEPTLDAHAALPECWRRWVAPRVSHTPSSWRRPPASGCALRLRRVDRGPPARLPPARPGRPAGEELEVDDVLAADVVGL